MGTHCSVNIEAADGTVQSIYVHSDGMTYGVGKALRTLHNSREAIQALIDSGDHSCILPDSEWHPGGLTKNYWDWRKEFCPAATSPDFKTALHDHGHGYNYLFTKDNVLKAYNASGCELVIE